LSQQCHLDKKTKKKKEKKNWTSLGSRGAFGMSETMTILAASITVIPLHARAGYMAHIKRSYFLVSNGVLSSTP